MAFVPFRVITLADATSFTLNSDADLNIQVNTQSVGTLTANAPTGNGKRIIFRIKSTNVQTYSWNGVFRGGTTVALPTASTGGGKTDYIGFVKNDADTKWDCVAVSSSYT